MHSKEAWTTPTWQGKCEEPVGQPTLEA